MNCFKIFKGGDAEKGYFTSSIKYRTIYFNLYIHFESLIILQTLTKYRHIADEYSLCIIQTVSIDFLKHLSNSESQVRGGVHPGQLASLLHSHLQRI